MGTTLRPTMSGTTAWINPLPISSSLVQFRSQWVKIRGEKTPLLLQQGPLNLLNHLNHLPLHFSPHLQIYKTPPDAPWRECRPHSPIANPPPCLLLQTSCPSPARNTRADHDPRSATAPSQRVLVFRVPLRIVSCVIVFVHRHITCRILLPCGCIDIRHSRTEVIAAVIPPTLYTATKNHASPHVPSPCLARN